MLPPDLAAALRIPTPRNATTISVHMWNVKVGRKMLLQQSQSFDHALLATLCNKQTTSKETQKIKRKQTG
jgi:hypothetical protein